ncbi:MAG: insulinase family protein [Firmicutes bacterium]|nr:insulinase family protein [Bacillota bacterium]MCM1402046.1 insulinase family protein [Bacteroides sp.]MCM1476777.1 insulinase family protein [Bacteroides sp.]
MQYSLHTLQNGLRVVHHHDPSTTHVVLNTLYNVGARNEDPAHTGMAHLFEHLMFGGSVNVPDFDKAVEMAGGSDNAWTSNDFTNFYTIVPALNVETAFWVESDRMLSLAFTPGSLEVQRKVVMEEFKQVCLNRPYGDLGHHLRALLYRVHPYRYPTIGRELSHIETVSMDLVRKFFFSHYAPNNAVLAVAGPISAERTFELAHKWYDSIPRREISPLVATPEPDIDSPRRETIVARVPQTRLTIAFLMVGANHPDYPAADLITDILASGQSARLNKHLVMGTDLFTSADASISGSEHRGFLMVNAALRSNSPAAEAEAEKLIWEQLQQLASGSVTEQELERALNRFETNRTFSLINYLAKARELAKSVLTNRDINKVTDQYRAVPPDQIRRVAAQLLRPQASATLIYRSPL